VEFGRDHAEEADRGHLRVEDETGFEQDEDDHADDDQRARDDRRRDPAQRIVVV